MSMQLTPQQHDAITLPPELIVSAAAGSGKTEVLVRRVLDSALCCGIPLDRMLIVTFTVSAAAELRERIRRGLTGDTTTTDLRAHLAALQRAQISTLHSFCHRIVQRFGYRDGLSAARILPDDEARLLRHGLCGELLRELLAKADPALRAAALSWGGADVIGADDLRRVAVSHGLRDRLLHLHDFRRALTDAPRWYREYVDLPPLDPERCDPTHPLVVTAFEPLQRWCAETAAASRELALALPLGTETAQALLLLQLRLDVLAQVQTCRDWANLPRLFALFENLPPGFGQTKSLLGSYTRGVTDEALKERLGKLATQVREQFKELRGFYGTPWPELALRENETRARLIALWRLAEEFDARYDARKRELGSVDYSDLETGALKLLAQRDESGAFVYDDARRLVPSDVAYELHGEIDLVLVDEYQDTSPIQDAIVELVTNVTNTKQRFFVGDVKQSIYAFRLANPALFAGHHARVEQDAGAGSALRLTGSFRSRPRILSAINAVFDGLMDMELGGEDYTLSRLTPAVDYAALCGEQYTPDLPARLHLVEVDKHALRASASDDDDEPDSDEGEEGETTSSGDPQYAKVATLLQELHGTPVYDKQLRGVRPAQWRDMVVLLRTSRGRVETLRRELERVGIPFYAPGRSGFYERPEIGDCLSLLAVVDNPRRDVPLAAALSGPAGGLTPADLARIVLGSSTMLHADTAQHYGADDLWSKVERYLELGADTALREKLAAFTLRLERWRNIARHATLLELLDTLYRESGLTAAAAAMRGGAQRLANLATLNWRAREFGRSNSNVGGFLDYIAAGRRAAGDTGDAPLLDEQQDVVRVLTVHQAKGLEFPIVVVPDLHRQFNRQGEHEDVQWDAAAGIGGRYYDLPAFHRYDTLARRSVREARRRARMSEELRLLYVALTRSRERLELVGAIEAGSADKLAEPRGDRARNWLQWVGPQSVNNTDWELHLCGGTDSNIGTSLAPPQADRDQLGIVVARLHAAYPYAAAARLPAKVAVTLLSETTLDLTQLDAERAVPLGEARAEQLASAPSFIRAVQPTAADAGTAVHKLLARIDPREFARYATENTVADLRAELIRRGLLSRRDAELIPLAQVARCCADLADKLPQHLGAQYRHYTELPVSLLVPAAEIAAALPELRGLDLTQLGDERVHVQGAIDLLLDDGQTVLVLDYKTGYTVDADALAELHAPQLRWYCRAVAALLPGRRVQWALYGLGGAGLVGPNNAPSFGV